MFTSVAERRAPPDGFFSTMSIMYELVTEASSPEQGCNHTYFFRHGKCRDCTLHGCSNVMVHEADKRFNVQAIPRPGNPHWRNRFKAISIRIRQGNDGRLRDIYVYSDGTVKLTNCSTEAEIMPEDEAKHSYNKLRQIFPNAFQNVQGYQNPRSFLTKYEFNLDRTFDSLSRLAGQLRQHNHRVELYNERCGDYDSLRLFLKAENNEEKKVLIFKTGKASACGNTREQSLDTLGV